MDLLICGQTGKLEVAEAVSGPKITDIEYSLEANHLIWVWIMKVKGPTNQADFIEVLYVVVNASGATFWNTWEYG